MKRYQAYILMAAGCLALALVAGVFTAAPAIAQLAKAVLVQNVDEPGRTPYSETSFFSANSGCTTTCTLQFSAVPPHKRLVITNVTGAAFLNTPGVLAPLILNGAGPSPGISIPTELQAGTLEGQNMIGFNAPIRAYVESNIFPRIFLTATTAFSINNDGNTGGSLTLSGYYINLP